MAPLRKYPVGIQSFESMRMDGYVYVDKTPLIYKMITEGCHYFLNRPRRFGKSLLCSTLEAVFQGRRELFEAFTTEYGIEQPQLFIATTDWEWEHYPVIRFDFSKAGVYTMEKLNILINETLLQYEEEYGPAASSRDFSTRFEYIILNAHRLTGRRAVVIVDEYDTFMLNTISNPDLEEQVRIRISSLFAPLKSLDDHLQFVFFTGISKFSLGSLYGSLNLNNISMTADYETLCGITEEELTTMLHTDIERLANKCGETYDETFAKLKRRYDGYHFSRRMTDIYNPFSLFNAFDAGEIADYWFDSASPSAVIQLLANMPPLKLTDIERVECLISCFNIPFDSFNYTLPVLYQSGYLTVKDYEREVDTYTLGFPNAEVRRGFAKCLYQYVDAGRVTDKEKNALLEAYYDFRDSNDLPPFIAAIKAFFAGIPYYLNEKGEHHYHVVLYTLLTAFDADISAEEPTAKGRADIILKMPKGIYVIEIKYDDTAEAALKQIEEKGYAEKYRLDGRPITKVGISFSSKERNITEWLASE